MNDKPFFFQQTVDHERYILCGHKYPSASLRPTNTLVSDWIKKDCPKVCQQGWHYVECGDNDEYQILASAPTYRVLKIKLKLMGISVKEMEKSWEP